MRLSISAFDPATDLTLSQALLREYAGSLGFSLAYQNFEAELAQLPGPYAPPGGALLLARADELPVGMVALRPLAPDICEMKRLYVRPAYRKLQTAEGLSLGRALASALLTEARTRGYRRLRLDTIAGQMNAANALYRSLGFREIPPYYPSPVPNTIYLELAL